MLKQFFKNRVFVVGLSLFVFFMGGCLLSLWMASLPGEFTAGTLPAVEPVPPFEERLLTGDPPASLVDAPLAAPPEGSTPPPKTARDPKTLDRIIREAINRNRTYAQAGRLEALRKIIDEAVANGEFPREERRSQLYLILKAAVSNGQISEAESTDIRQRYRAMILTEGMSAWEAAQYFDRNGSPSRAYTKELADEALAADPDDPERLYFWSTKQPYNYEGPNPERDAVYAKIVDMEGIPPKERASYLRVIGGLIWHYKPEESLRYLQEAEALTGKTPISMGRTYQRLGQYHKALAVYRKDYARNQTAEADKHIRAILNGTPLIASIHKARQEKADADRGTPAAAPMFSRGSPSLDTPDTEFPTRSERVGADTRGANPDAEQTAAARTEH